MRPKSIAILVGALMLAALPAASQKVVGQGPLAALSRLARRRGRLHHLAQGEGRLPPARQRPGARDVHHGLLEGPGRRPEHAREQVQGRALSPHRIRQQATSAAACRPAAGGPTWAGSTSPWASRRTIERYENESNLYPLHRSGSTPGSPGAGLPSSFNIVFFKKDDGRRLHPLLPGPGRPPEAHAVLQRRHDELPPGLGRAEADRRSADRPGLDVPHPGRVRHGLNPIHVLRHPHQPEDPQDGLRQRQGRLRREAPQVQGHRRGRIHGQLHRERRPRPGHARRRRPGLRPLSSSSRPG